MRSIAGNASKTLSRVARVFTALTCLLAISLGCVPGDSQQPLQPISAGGIHVLFIGNSLTYVNDLPGTLVDLALTRGDTIKTAAVAYPDFALVDHLREGTAAKAIKLGGWKYVVLQQGPSSVQVNRDSLIDMTRIFDASIKAVGATSALYSVWPQAENYFTFDRAIESYQLAASAVGGLYLPVGAAWRAGIAANSSLQLYATDGLHASPLGTYLAALVMYEKFTGKDARLLPGQAVVAGAVVSSSESTVRALQQLAHDANLAAR